MAKIKSSIAVLGLVVFLVFVAGCVQEETQKAGETKSTTPPAICTDSKECLNPNKYCDLTDGKCKDIPSSFDCTKEGCPAMMKCDTQTKECKPV